MPADLFSVPLVLLDRDGTLIEEKEYLKDPRDVRLLPGVARGLQRLKRSGMRLVVISNQSGVGRGLITLSQARRVNQRFFQILKQMKAPIDGYYWCPHAPEKSCACRKPKLALVKRAAKDLGVPWKGCISVGDRKTDVQMGQRTGGLGILVLTGYGKRWKKEAGADHIAKNFKDAAAWLIEREHKYGIR